MNEQLSRSATTVANYPRRIQAIAEIDSESTVVHTIASMGVKEASRWFSEVRELVEGQCFTVHRNSLVKDPSMWWGWSRVSEVEIHRSCPATTHYCVTEGLSLGQALGME